MDGTELACRFSYITNKLRFCGPKDASIAFLKFLEEKTDADSVQKLLERFEALKPYLQTIATKHGKAMFDDDVVEAYWIGNHLLDAFRDEDMKGVVELLMEHGLPRSIGEKKIAELPSGMMPHHNFNVFYVGVGNITGSVDVTLGNMENCRVSWGIVVELMSGSAAVKMKCLKRDGDELILGNEEIKTAVVLPEMIVPAVGDVVAMHWGMVCMKLSESQQEKLEKYTSRIVDSLQQ